MPKRRQPSLAGGNVKKSPSSKAAAILTRGAYIEVHEHGKMATCLRVAASAKAGNAAGGIFQHSHILNAKKRFYPRVLGVMGREALRELFSFPAF